ncbi:Hypp5104 [Branchiostoma lanceolatum]|uniref:Hypp5104 protein n=1 Tax=Branchiostoma lanceolatum TaxID=7740 RepID=A0A8K0ACE3_BRALA|nr:Hypp5104 [Branchiostoma lanceolatum]
MMCTKGQSLPAIDEKVDVGPFSRKGNRRTYWKNSRSQLPAVYFHCTIIICFKDDLDSRCKQGCIPAGRRRRAVTGGTEGRVRWESSLDHAAKMTQGPFKVAFEEAETGSAKIPVVEMIIGVTEVMVFLIVVVVLVKKWRGLALGRKKRDGLENYVRVPGLGEDEQDWNF